MSTKCKFIRIEAWARKGPHQKNSKLRKPSMAGVLNRDRHHIATKAARLIVERTAEAQREAAAQVTAVETAAARQIEQMKQRALTQIQCLAIENGAPDAEIKHRAALPDEQAKRIAAVEAMLAE